MVTTSLRRGSTTFAFFQNASSVGWTSGSASMPSRISASPRRRSLFQSVPRSVFEVLPEVAPFVRLRPPRRDDAPLAIVFIGVNHCDFQAVHKADDIDSNLAIVETIIDLLDRRPFENPLGVIEGNSVPCNIAAVLPLVPTVAHAMYLHNVNIAIVDLEEARSAEQHPRAAISGASTSRHRDLQRELVHAFVAVLGHDEGVPEE